MQIFWLLIQAENTSSRIRSRRRKRERQVSRELWENVIHWGFCSSPIYIFRGHSRQTLVGWALKLWQLVKQVNFFISISFYQFVTNQAPNRTTPIDDQVTKLAANLHSSWETFSIQVKFSFSEFSFDWLNLMSLHCFAGTFWDSFSPRVGTISAL